MLVYLSRFQPIQVFIVYFDSVSRSTKLESSVSSIFCQRTGRLSHGLVNLFRFAIHLVRHSDEITKKWQTSLSGDFIYYSIYAKRRSSCWSGIDKFLLI